MVSLIVSGSCEPHSGGNDAAERANENERHASEKINKMLWCAGRRESEEEMARSRGI